jgi:hypothetical protein
MDWWQNAGTMLIRRLTFVLFLVGATSQPWVDRATAQETLRYTITSNGKVAGNEVDTYGPGVRVDSTFEFNDRGRGPKISAHYVISSGSLPLRADITGNDYLKAPVDEHFAVENGRTSWKSTSEDGSATVDGFYISNNGPVAETALLVAALLKAKDVPVRLLPAGEARLERLTDATIEDHGQKLHVTEFAVTGLSFEPQTIWLDDNQRFFGSPGPWFAILREGWEGANKQLYDLQLKAQDARYAHLANKLALQPSHPIAIEHVRVFDSEQATARENQTVVIEGERILQAGPAASIHPPKDAERIDGTGKTLLPGLFDMHAHAQPLGVRPRIHLKFC